jgi:hypothetical protein
MDEAELNRHTTHGLDAASFLHPARKPFRLVPRPIGFAAAGHGQELSPALKWPGISDGTSGYGSALFRSPRSRLDHC